MEKIRINEITKKDSGLVIVKYDKYHDDYVWEADKEATLNTKWQSQEVNVLENDVGIGGTIDVEIVIKGQYTNITKIDFNSAVKGQKYMTTDGSNQDECVGIATMGVVDSKPIPSRDHSIIAQCMLKVEYRNCPSPRPLDIVESYRFYLKELFFLKELDE